MTNLGVLYNAGKFLAGWTKGAHETLHGRLGYEFYIRFESDVRRM